MDAWAQEQADATQSAEKEAYRKQLISLVYPDAFSLPETLQNQFANISTVPQDIDNLQEMWNLPLSEIIARMIIGEAGDRRISDQDRVDICYSIIVRMLDDQRFNSGLVQNNHASYTTSNKNQKYLKGLLFGDDQYHALNPFYDDPNANTGGYLGYKIESNYLSTGKDAQRIWEQAKWMGAILAELFEGKTAADLYVMHGYIRDNWRSLADMYFDEFGSMLGEVYPDIAKGDSKVRGDYKNSFIGKRDESGNPVVIFSRQEDRRTR